MGQLPQTVFNSSAIARFMMNKSMDQKPEVNVVIRFYFVKQGIDKHLNYKLKRLSSSLLIFVNKIKDIKEALQLPRFLQVGLRLRSSCGSLIFAALL